MDTLVHADIFFFVTTIAVVLVSAGLLWALVYIVGAVKRLEVYVHKIAENTKDATEEVKEMGEDIRDSFLYQLLFKKKKKHGK
ncbi:MAG: hypothetical protein JWN89_417 [Parcubacteria group bacterium]|nr:hypothetical protein [Parcubacteria group bacterium]